MRTSALRRAGILLHPTSLWGRGPGGTLGREAHAFVDSLADAGIVLWQVLPLGPPDAGGSPYMCRSAMAGNPALISLELLVEGGWLGRDWLRRLDEGGSLGDPDTAATLAREAMVEAWQRVKSEDGETLHAVQAFRSERSDWLEAHARFEVLAAAHGGRLWTEWPAEFRQRNPEALATFAEERVDEVSERVLAQYFFEQQWMALKQRANLRGIRVLGDVPIFVSLQSADVWQNPDLFELDDDGTPTHVAGVPPDYFSEVGQRWGNPLYRWDRMALDGFAWWKRRLARDLSLCDELRLDHFRGFSAYWAIPAEAENAIAGEWRDGPGLAFFRELTRTFGSLPFIAEDLGSLDEAVHVLRENCGLPGMRILQFAFGGDAMNPYLPHNHTRDTVVYTGTHDNDTSQGWYAAADEGARDHVRRYLATDGSNMAAALLHEAWKSVADLCIAPVQDVLFMPRERRMNSPGTQDGNWRFRLRDGEWGPEQAGLLRSLNTLAGRMPATGVAAEREDGTVDCSGEA